MSQNWGPNFIVPSETLKKFSGSVLLREEFDEDVLAKEMKELGISGPVERVVNPWYYRRKGTDTWIKIGESDDKAEYFRVRWDTRRLENGKYDILGLMHIVFRSNGTEHAIARQNMVEVTVEN